MKREAGVIPVNIHVPFEGDVPGPLYDEIGASLDRLPEGENFRLRLYCESARMSTEAARTLVETGLWQHARARRRGDISLTKG